MSIYSPDAITCEGVNGHRYWLHEPFPLTHVADIDERLSGFPVAVFLPRDRYGLTDSRLALFRVSMGVLQTAFAFTANGIGERLLGAIGHANIKTFAQSWGTMYATSSRRSWAIGEIDILLSL